MLSFYEMDLLLQKNKKTEKIDEGLSDFLRQKAMALAAKMKGKGAAPAAAAPSVPNVAAPAMAAPKAAPTPVAPQPQSAQPVMPIQSDKGPQSSDDIINSLLASMGKKPGAAQGAEMGDQGGGQRPALIKRNHDPKENMPRKEFKRLGDQDSTVVFWNKLLKSGNEIGEINPETGVHGKVSTWAWALLGALKQLGAQVPNLKDGDTFQLAFAPGQSGQNDMPEVIVDPNVLERANKIVWAKLGNERMDNDRISNVPKINSFSGALLQGLVKGQTPEEQESSLNRLKMGLKTNPNPDMAKRIRAVEFEKMIRHHSIAGKDMTVMQLATELGKQTLNGGLEQSDPRTDLDAVVHLIKTDKMGKYHTFAIPKGPLTVDTIIHINSPDELGKSADPLLTPTPVGSPDFAKGNAGADTRTIGQLDTQGKRQRTMRSRRIGGTQAESNGWVEIQESMEHWGW